MKRRSISKKIRFEVLKRDSFKCQYCGHSAPDVLLAVDHIHPVALGGDNEIVNLITSCEDCNSGKGAVKLTDNAVLDKTREQLAALQERRNQLKMMMEWKNGLKSIDEDSVTEIEKYWMTFATGSNFTASGKADIRKWLKKYSVDEITSAIDVVCGHYFEIKIDGEWTHESIELGFSKIYGVCSVRRQSKTNPNLVDLLYVRGILRNRFHLRPQQGSEALKAIKYSHEQGYSILSMQEIAKTSDSYEDAIWLITTGGDDAEGKSMREWSLAQEEVAGDAR